MHKAIYLDPQKQSVIGKFPLYKYSRTSHIREVWGQGVPVIVKVPVSMNPLVPV